MPSGTTAIAAGLYLEIPNWTATGTITDSATLYVEGAATEGGTDYAVWVDAGDTRLDGDLDVAAAATSIKILDNSATALVIKEASTAYMSFITTNSGEKVEMGKALDMNGQELILDANANTSITADTDDQIDIKIAGADDFQFTANTFTVLSGSTLAIASGATIANSGTATGFPSAAEADTVTKTAAYTVVAGDDNKTILCSAASADYELALTAAATLGDGFQVTITKQDSTPYMITLNPNGSESIDGLPTLKLRNEHSSVSLICDGSNFHIQHHSNIEILYNAVQNGSILIDQYDHNTRTGLGGSDLMLCDRWKFIQSGSAGERFTFSIESDGGVDGKSRWMKALVTTAGSPDSDDLLTIRQSIIGNTMVGKGYLGSDGKWEDGILSFDVLVTKGGSSSISYPAKIGASLVLMDGTSREILTDISVAADSKWERVHWHIPLDATGTISPGTNASVYFSLALSAGSDFHNTADAWRNTANDYGTSSSDNFFDSTGNIVGIANVSFSPGQIAPAYGSIARSHENELATCQFYFEKFSYAAVDSEHVLTGVFRDNNTCHGILEWSPKRATPSVSSSAAGTFKVREHDGTQTVASAIAFDTIGALTARADATTTGTPGTAGQGAWFIRDGTDTTYIIVDADI